MIRYCHRGVPEVALLIVVLTISLLACGPNLAQGDIEATIAAGVEATRQAESQLQATVNAAIVATQVMATQVAAPPGQASPMPLALTLTPAPDSAAVSDQTQVEQVILAEVDGAIDQNLPLLKLLYSPEATVVDRNRTPNDPADDSIWRGWPNIERRYLAFFSAGFSSARLVDLSIRVEGDRAVGTHQGVILDGTFYEDLGVYSLERRDGKWLITELVFGNKSPAVTPTPPFRDDGLYVLRLGNQHRYEEPWGWDKGDPCRAWQSGDWDDTRPHYRGFNVELLLTNNSDLKAPDDWPITFTTAKGKAVKACYYAYQGSGPEPGATSSVTFFTVVEQGDYVEVITFQLDDQLIRLCLNGQGGASRC